MSPLADFPLLDPVEPCAAWTPAGLLVLWLPGSLPSTQNARTHWRARLRETRDWDLRVRAALSSLPDSPRLRHPVRVRYELHYCGNARDTTNAAGSVKHPEDSLVSCGVLEDDAHGFVHNTVEQVRVASKSQTGLLILLEQSP